MNVGELFITLGAKTDSSWKSGLDQIKQMGLVANRMSQSMGQAAKSAADVAKNAASNMRQAVRMAALDARVASDKVIDASRRQAAAVEASAKRQAAAHALVARSSMEAARVAGLAARGGRGRGSGINWGAVGDPFNPGGQSSAIRQASENARLMAQRAINSPGVQAIRNMQNNLRGYIPMEELLAERTGAYPSVGWAQFRANAPARRAQTVVDGGANPGFIGATRGGGRLNKFVPGSGGGMFGNGDGPPARGGGGGGGAGARGGRGKGGGGFYSRYGALGQAAALRRIVYGAGIFQGGQAFGQLADVYLNLQNRIRGITGSQAEANATFDRLYSIANKTRSGIESTAEAYVRIRNATDGMNLSGEDQYKLIERINMALATSGATASEARSGMMQLTQALAKGKLDGDEFRSIAENMPNILKILGKALNKNEGQLRAMSRAGQLTREKLVKAFLGDNSVEDAFNKTNATFGQTYELFKNKLVKEFGKLAEDKDLVEAFRFALEYLGKALVLLVKILGGAIEKVKAFVDGLKDGKPWAYALAAAISLVLLPSIINLLTYLAKLPMAFAEAAAAGKSFGAGGAAGAGAKGAKGAGSAGSGIGGKLGEVLFGAAATFDLASELMQGHNPVGFGMKPSAVSRAVAAIQQDIAIGPTTVNIYAKDAKDAKEQFDDDAMKRAQRHAAAAFNRRGS